MTALILSETYVRITLAVIQATWEARTVGWLENWLSPVIQATWEARAMGWLKVERLLPSADVDSVAARWPPYFGEVYRGGLTPMTR